MPKFQFAEMSEKSIGLFGDVKRRFESSNIASIRTMATKVPCNFVDEDKKVNVVFAGQYSAGKSTIISMMTGAKLDIGQGVTTGTCHTLEWNGIHIVDTPGIHTQNRTDHDAITYQALAEADLIVFVITGEGFSAHLGRHFRKLAVERSKGREMMLVVNKMESTADGNTEEQQKIILEKDILPVISPEYKPEDLSISFVDAKAYQEAQKEKDPEKRQFLLEISGFGSFYENLNKFVKEKKLMGRCTTSLYRVEQLLQDALNEFKTGNLCVDGSRHLLNQQRQMLVEAKQTILEQSHKLIRGKTQKVVQWGDEIADELSSEQKQTEVNSLLKEKYSETNGVYENAVEELEKILNLETGKLQEKIEHLQTSEFARRVEDAIKDAVKEIKIEKDTFEKTKKGADFASGIGKWLADFAKGADAKKAESFFKMAGYSGSEAHKAILGVGHIFGHKFAPWEAVRGAKILGQTGKILGVAGALLGVGLQIWNDCQESEAEQKMLEYRSDIRASFRDAANIINMKFDEATGNWVAECLDKEIASIDSRCAELDDLLDSKESEINDYKKMLKMTQDLIRAIQDAA